MSFQGDVAGIGLGELLQSLARGGQDGVLRLFGSQESASIGIRGGMLFLLPGPDENEESVRLRCQRAWKDDPDPQFEDKRRADISNASRLEILYHLIDSTNVHFRFEPGSVPVQEPVPGLGDSDLGVGVPWSQGLSVEFVLLEHARLSDESGDGASQLHAYDIPRIVNMQAAQPDAHAFLEHCTGRTTLRELADRLGWTLLQTCVTVHDFVRSGILRMAEPRELLVAGQHELVSGRKVRGAQRIAGWIRSVPPGPPLPGDAELILNEWEEGLLRDVLAEMEPRLARSLLRKLDFVDPDQDACIARWEVLRQTHRRDNVAAIHLAALKLERGGAHEAVGLTDLMRIMRTLEDEGFGLRAMILLRLAAAREPTTDKARIELASYMLEMGLEEQGVQWLLNVGRDLLKRKRGERAVGPLREILRHYPGHPLARDLLEEAQQQGARRRMRRVHSTIGLALAVLLGAGAFVQYRAQVAYDKKLVEVNDTLSDPDRALALIARHFPDDDSERILELRTSLVQRKQAEEVRRRDEWLERFTAAKTEAESGDPLMGLQRALDLALPPRLDGDHPPFPARSEILNVLANRLAELTVNVDPPVDASAEELRSETRLVTLMEAVLSLTADLNTKPDIEAFAFRVKDILEELESRRETRALQRRQVAEVELEERLNLLLSAARSHRAAGDLHRALLSYKRLMALDNTEELTLLLEDEIQAVEDQVNALNRARELALEGQHQEAYEALDGVVQDVSAHFLPWRIESDPPGVRVTFADGDQRHTPFVMESAIGETIQLRFSLDGFEEQIMLLQKPIDVRVKMHRLPDREWYTSHRVEAAPVPIADDHIVADRFGRVARLSQDGELQWSHELATIAGIARTPVFLPGRPGHVLVVSEDGQAWLIDASNGLVEGPWKNDSPPLEGPVLTKRGVSVRFANGHIALWKDRLRPVIYEVEGTYLARTGATEWNSKEDVIPGNIAVLRRGPNSEPKHVSQWTGWTIDVREDEYLVRDPASDSPGFTIRRLGDWSFLAWEAPNALIPKGRMWVSDDGGLRCFLPFEPAAEEPDDKVAVESTQGEREPDSGSRR